MRKMMMRKKKMTKRMMKKMTNRNKSCTSCVGISKRSVNFHAPSEQHYM